MLPLLSEQEILKEYNLKEMIRYNHRMHVQKESVAAHSFYVALFCLKIMQHLQLTPQKERAILVKAILHDVPESYMSDIPHDVKKNNMQLKTVLEKVEQDYLSDNWRGYVYATIYSDDVENLIVKLADAYSVQQYCLSEISLGNSTKEMNDILEDAKVRVINFTTQLNNIKGIH